MMCYVAAFGLLVVAMCFSTTYGSGHAHPEAFISCVVFGKLPFLMNGIGCKFSSSDMYLNLDDSVAASREYCGRLSRRAAAATVLSRPRYCNGPGVTGKLASSAHRQRCRTSA